MLLTAIVVGVAVALSGQPAVARAERPIHEDTEASLQIFGDASGDLLQSVAVGDLNGDGAEDLVGGSFRATSAGVEFAGEISVVQGPVGPGTFQASDIADRQFAAPGEFFVGFNLATGDVNGDGIDDIISAALDRIVVFLGAPDFFDVGAGVAPDVRTVELLGVTATGFLAVAIADMDGDGIDDIVYGSPEDEGLPGTNEVIIFFGPFTEGAGGALNRAALARIQAPPDTTVFGFTLAAGDLTGDGQADLAINFVDASDQDSILVLPGPFSKTIVLQRVGREVEPLVTIPSDRVGIAHLAIGDVDLDGANDLIVGRTGFPADVSVIPGRVLAPARFSDLRVLSGEIYTSSTADPSFGRRVAVGDYDGDGLADLLVGSSGPQEAAGAVQGFAGADRGALLHGVRPTSVVAGSGVELEIYGQGFLNPTVVFLAEDGAEIEVAQDEGANGVAVAADSLGILHVPLPDALPPGLIDVLVRTDIGEVTLENAFVVEPPPPPPPPPPTRTVQLADGWNLVGWTGNTVVTDAIATIVPSFAALFTWDAAGTAFRSFISGAPPILNSLSDLTQGQGVWINTPGGAIWEQPAFTAARTASLLPGFNLEMWTGPDGTPVSEAVADLGDAFDTLFTWEADPQAFDSYTRGALDILNDPIVLDFGDGVWIRVNAALDWHQPASGPPPPPPGDDSADGLPLATTVQEAEAATVFISNGLGSGSGFVVSETQILTNQHVVGGARSVLVRFMNGEERQGLVTALDGPLDVAVIEVADLPEGVRRLDWETAEAPAPATDVWVWGFPFGEFLGDVLGSDVSATVTAGIVSAIQTFDVLGEAFSVVQTDADLNPGNSGGPIIIEDGRVVGISDFGVTFGEGLNFGIDVAAHRDRIRALLAQ